MKQEKASSTAEGRAALRAVESLKPEDERVCYDPLVQHFLGGKYRVFARSRFLTRLALWNAERQSPGEFGCQAGRTRYIDDCLMACIDNGVKQLVILCAGFDSRAYRIGEIKEKAKVFDICLSAYVMDLDVLIDRMRNDSHLPPIPKLPAFDTRYHKGSK